LVAMPVHSTLHRAAWAWIQKEKFSWNIQWVKTLIFLTLTVHVLWLLCSPAGCLLQQHTAEVSKSCSKNLVRGPIVWGFKYPSPVTEWIGINFWEYERAKWEIYRVH
jgi:hypothetical protein